MSVAISTKGIGRGRRLTADQRKHAESGCLDYLQHSSRNCKHMVQQIYERQTLTYRGFVTRHGDVVPAIDAAYGKDEQGRWWRLEQWYPPVPDYLLHNDEIIAQLEEQQRNEDAK